MAVVFQLYMYVNTEITFNYPYVGISNGTRRMIYICDDHIAIFKEGEISFCASDYLPTSRYIELDLARLDSIIRSYTLQPEYTIVTHFTDDKLSTLSYYSSVRQRVKDYHLFVGCADERAEKLAMHIYPVMEQIKQATWQID